MVSKHAFIYLVIFQTWCNPKHGLQTCPYHFDRDRKKLDKSLRVEFANGKSFYTHLCRYKQAAIEILWRKFYEFFSS